MKTLIFDFSQIAYSAKFQTDGKGSDLWQLNLWRSVVLKMLKKHIKNFNPDDVVLAMDGKHSWRKDVDEYYKKNRYESKKDNNDWISFYSEMNNFIDELINIFPYKCIKLENVEGDDIIAILTQKIPGEIVIISSDHDLTQLMLYNKNITIFNPIKNEEIPFYSESELKLIQETHIIKGDTGDGVPNIFSDRNTFTVKGKRQKVTSSKKLNSILERGINDYLKLDTTTSIKEKEKIIKNYQLNYKLVVLKLDNIPNNHIENVMNEYNKKIVYDVENIKSYLKSKRMVTLFENINEFLFDENKNKNISINTEEDFKNFISSQEIESIFN